MEKREYVLRIRTWQYMGTTRGKLSGDNYRLGYRVIAGTFQPVVPTHFLYLYIYIYREREREREREEYILLYIIVGKQCMIYIVNSNLCHYFYIQDQINELLIVSFFFFQNS